MLPHLYLKQFIQNKELLMCTMTKKPGSVKCFHDHIRVILSLHKCHRQDAAYFLVHHLRVCRVYEINLVMVLLPRFLLFCSIQFCLIIDWYLMGGGLLQRLFQDLQSRSSLTPSTCYLRNQPYEYFGEDKSVFEVLGVPIFHLLISSLLALSLFKLR